MRGGALDVLVIGGGVVGMATAYFLVESGLSVTLLERRENAGLETSNGNAGLYSPSDAFAWASPAALKMAVRSLVQPDLGIRYNLRLDPQLWRWSAAFLAQCRPAAYRRNSAAKIRLALYSRDMLRQLRANTGVEYDAADAGIVYASRSAAGLRALAAHYRFLEDRGLRLMHLDRDALIAKVPVLAATPDTYAGAVYSPDCSTGDSAKFSRALAKWCVEHRDICIEYGVHVEKIVTQNRSVACVQTSKGEFRAEAYVLAAGPESAALARPAGIRLPIVPVKGFSITAPVIEGGQAPTAGFDDTDRLVAVSTFGNRLRITSSAVFDGFNKSHKPQDFAAILRLAQEVFPNAADYSKATYWAGLRPMTPSSKPVLGASKLRNLFLNVGHGHLGWTLSCGTGKIVADIVNGQSPDTDVAAFRL